MVRTVSHAGWKLGWIPGLNMVAKSPFSKIARNRIEKSYLGCPGGLGIGVGRPPS